MAFIVQNREFKISFVTFKVQSTLKQQTKGHNRQKQKHKKKQQPRQSLERKD